MPDQLPPRNNIDVVKMPATRTSRVPMFCILRNEMYFLPHLLAHYRKLGIEEFWFLDDHSDDGSFEYLKAQPDCALMRSGLRFGDLTPTGQRFGAACKNIIPPMLLKDRWVLTVDADEFLILPEPFDTVPQLADALERNGLESARAVMLDFFPTTLDAVESAAPGSDPFAICPFFDPWKQFAWPDRAPNVTSLTVGDGVRPRLLAELMRRKIDFGMPFSQYRFANINKAPLAHWHEGMEQLTAHRLKQNPSDRVQAVLAHFKFFPGHRQRTRAAMERGVHFNGSVEYRILDLANENLSGWPLQGPVTRRFASREDLMETGLLYSRLA